MGGLARTPPAKTMKSKHSSKFLPLFEVLQIGASNEFTDLNSYKLTELFKKLQEIDPKTAKHTGKVQEKEVSRLWAQVFSNDSSGTMTFDGSHRLFKETSMQSRNIILKNHYSNEKYLASTIVSKNAASIINLFNQPKEATSSDLEDQGNIAEADSDATSLVRMRPIECDNIDLDLKNGLKLCKRAPCLVLKQVLKACKGKFLGS